MKSKNTNPVGGQAGQIKSMKNLLVPIDFSNCSRHALQYALFQAKETGGKITLITVIPDSHTSYEYGVAEAIELQERRKRQLEQDLTQLANDTFNGVPHQIVVKSGKPFEEIVREAKDLAADLIVISTHGHPGETQVDLGSTTERVVRYATCPVLVVRCSEENQPATAV